MSLTFILWQFWFMKAWQKDQPVECWNCGELRVPNDNYGTCRECDTI